MMPETVGLRGYAQAGISLQVRRAEWACGLQGVFWFALPRSLSEDWFLKTKIATE